MRLLCAVAAAPSARTSSTHGKNGALKVKRRNTPFTNVRAPKVQDDPRSFVGDASLASCSILAWSSFS